MNCAEKIIQHFGGSMTHAALQLGVSKQRLSNWKVRGAIPTREARKVESATAGKVTQQEILNEHELRQRLRRRKSS